MSAGGIRQRHRASSKLCDSSLALKLRAAGIPASRVAPASSLKRPAAAIAPDMGCPVLSFLGPASALLGALQEEEGDPLASMSQADKDALNLAAIFSWRLARRMEQLGISVGDGELGPFHRPRVQPSTAAKLWGPAAAAAADGEHTARRREEEAEEQRILHPLKRSRGLPPNDAQTGDNASRQCVLVGLYCSS